MLSASLVLGACGGSSESAMNDATTDAPNERPATTSVTTTKPVSTKPESTDAAAAASPDATVTSVAEPTVMIQHALGEIAVQPEPQRVVALDRSLLDPALALGLPIVGYTTYSDPNGTLPEYFGEAIEQYAADAVWVGDLIAPNLEAIAALEPDLILTAAVRHENIYDQLSAIAPTLASDSAGGGWKDTLRQVAELTDRSAMAEELLADYEARAADVGAAINASAGNPTISVVRFVDAIRLYTPVSFSGVVLEDAGLARPEAQQDRSDFIRIISEEELGLADADVMFYTVFDNETVTEHVEGIQSRPLWSTLGAVQNGQAHPVPDDTWMSGVGIYGANQILDDLETTFGLV